MAKQTEEINPFIAYVDLFTSVIMVLMLFLLVMFVNVGYYIQVAASKAEVMDETETSVMVEEPIEEVEEVEQEEQTGEDKSLVIQQSVEKTPAEVTLEVKELKVMFKDNELFIPNDMVLQIRKRIEELVADRPASVVYVYVSDPQKVRSATIAKQISLGRALNLRNLLRKHPILKDRVLVRTSKNRKDKSEHGHIKIDVR